MRKILFLYLMLSAGLVTAQDLFQKNLYSADRVMGMRKELKLTDAQATSIKNIHSENAGKFSAMKWDLDDATEKLKALLDQTKVDAVAVQRQMDKVLTLENSLKKQQLSTMVSIKNELSPEQQGILQSHRAETLNGVSVFGYGKSGTPATSVYGYSTNLRTGTPQFGVAGVGSASNPKVSVVVAGTNNSENPPLYYMDTDDGMKQLKTLRNIDPNDIESIEVLKDEAAIDLFGEKAKHGVVIVKLKSNPTN